MNEFRYPALLLLVVALYWGLVLSTSTSKVGNVAGPEGRVVIAAPLQVALAFGDRYLAANIEAMRLAATGMEANPETGAIDGNYLLRGHLAVSELNPCHEDNYYLANALLAWGGADESSNKILDVATQCRHWDFLPPFLYGFNEYFFNRNIPEAQNALKIAASRSPDNSEAMKRFSIMIGTEEFDDEAMALAYLEEQKSQAKSSTLSKSLQDRIVRLQGLLILRSAQAAYETEYDQQLVSPEELLSKEILNTFPNDPLGIGYEFVDGKFKLRQLRIQGVERPQ